MKIHTRAKYVKSQENCENFTAAMVIKMRQEIISSFVDASLLYASHQVLYVYEKI